MDDRLLELSVGYHGQEILPHFNLERPDFEIPSFISPPAESSISDSPRNAKFEHKLMNFIAKKSDILFKGLDQPPEFPCNERKNKEFACTPPLEAFMDTTKDSLREHFVKSLKSGDVVSGFVSAIQVTGLVIKLICVDVGQLRHINHLNIKVFCPNREFPRYVSNEINSDTFAIDDKVRGVVIEVSKDREAIIISLEQSSLPEEIEYKKLGLIQDEDFPSHYRHFLLAQEDDSSYCDVLHNLNGFRNSSNVATLCKYMGIDKRIPFSFMRNLNVSEPNTRINVADLRKSQSYRWAINSVAKGVQLFKQGNHVEAMQYLNKALQIDSENVEAMVARGALFANKESYERAIEDFEKALELNPGHNNAKNYYRDTLLAHSRSLIDKEKVDEAEEILHKAKKCNANSEVIEEMLEDIENYRKQEEVKKKQSEEIKKHEIEDVTKSAMQMTADRLRKMVEEDRKRHKNKRDSTGSKDVGVYSSMGDSEDKVETKNERLKMDHAAPNKEHNRLPEESAGKVYRSMHMSDDDEGERFNSKDSKKRSRWLSSDDSSDTPLDNIKDSHLDHKSRGINESDQRFQGMRNDSEERHYRRRQSGEKDYRTHRSRDRYHGRNDSDDRYHSRHHQRRDSSDRYDRPRDSHRRRSSDEVIDCDDVKDEVGKNDSVSLQTVLGMSGIPKELLEEAMQNVMKKNNLSEKELTSALLSKCESNTKQPKKPIEDMFNPDDDVVEFRTITKSNKSALLPRQIAIKCDGNKDSANVAYQHMPDDLDARESRSVVNLTSESKSLVGYDSSPEADNDGISFQKAKNIILKCRKTKSKSPSRRSYSRSESRSRSYRRNRSRDRYRSRYSRDRRSRSRYSRDRRSRSRYRRSRSRHRRSRSRHRRSRSRHRRSRSRRRRSRSRRRYSRNRRSRSRSSSPISPASPFSYGRNTFLPSSRSSHSHRYHSSDRHRRKPSQSSPKSSRNPGRDSVDSSKSKNNGEDDHSTDEVGEKNDKPEKPESKGEEEKVTKEMVEETGENLEEMEQFLNRLKENKKLETKETNNSQK